MLMKFGNLPMVAAAVALTTALCFGNTGDATHAGAKAKTSSHRSAHHRRARGKKVRGQKAIDGERVRQIQEALIREHYLKGEPSGKWDDSTQGAMRRYQTDQGWQNKTVPDSRALIRLGLGPDNDHLLNPESAMTAGNPRSNSGIAKTSAESTGTGSAMPGNAVAAPPSNVSDPTR